MYSYNKLKPYQNVAFITCSIRSLYFAGYARAGCRRRLKAKVQTRLHLLFFVYFEREFLG